MEDNTQESQPITNSPSPDLEQPVKQTSNISMPKILLIILAIIILLGIGIYLYRSYSNKTITTTGAVVTPSTPTPDDPYLQLNKLLDLGEIAMDGFTIKNVSRSTSVAVFLSKPYDQNQEKFETWLKANGYGDIPKEKIVYFHQP